MIGTYETGKGGKSRPRSFWLLLLLEMSTIIVAVMLGFWVNEWRENRQHQAQVEEAKYRVASELNYNHPRMAMLYSYYDLILRNIEARIASDPDFNPMTSYGYHIEGFRGAMPPLLRSSTFHMLLNSGILAHFDVETADDIAFIYNMQRIIETLDQAILSSVSDDTGFTRITTVRHTFGLFTELIPIVLATYEVHGLRHFAAHGFRNEIEHERLRKAIAFQMTEFQ